MANWTVSSYSNAETQGDNVTAGTMAAYADLIITPNVGYVISATNFKIGGATESPTNTWTGGNVDSEIYKVVFSDVGTAGTVSNTVRARVHFTTNALDSGTSWNMPGNNDTLYIDIDEKEGQTAGKVDRNFCIRTQHTAETDGNGVNKHTVTYAAAPTNITTTNNTPLIHNIGDGLVEHLHQGTVPEGAGSPGTLIFSVDFDAEENFGYFYTSVPTVSTLTGPYSSYYTFISSGELYDSNNNLIFVNIKGYYDPPVGVTGLDPDPGSTAAQMCELGQSVLIDHVIRQEPQGEPGSKPRVRAVLISQANLPKSGQFRSLQVTGDENATFVLTIVSSDSSKTYDFTTNTFTATATNSGSITLPNTGFYDWTITFPAITSDTVYDIYVTPNVNTSTEPGVPTALNELEIYQYDTVDVTLGLNDSSNVYDDGELLDGSPNTAVVISGEAGVTLDRPITKEFSYTITEAMVTADISGLGEGIAPKSTLNWDLDGQGNLTVKLNGEATGTSFDVDSTAGVYVGNDISWSVQKTSAFDVTTDVITPRAYDPDQPTFAPDLTNLVVGMQLTSFKVSERDNVTITAVDTADSSIHLSKAVTIGEQEPLTFTTRGITVSSVTDSTTLVASQTMAGVQDDFVITIGGGQSDAVAGISKGTATQSGDNVILAGTFELFSIPEADKTVRLDLNELITITDS